jgi:DNA-binding NtrC family response regulator
VGGTEPIPVDVRVIAATNQSLQRLVDDGRFREDLFFRLNVVKINPPPLRDRGSDLMRLAQYFSSTIAARYGKQPRAVAPQTRTLLFSYSWPGNVRELRNAIERAYVVGTGPEIRPCDLPIAVSSHRIDTPDLALGESSALPPFPEAKQTAIDRFERAYLQTLMARSTGNVTEAAEEAGILRQALQRLLKRHAIDRTNFFDSDEDHQAAS